MWRFSAFLCFEFCETSMTGFNINPRLNHEDNRQINRKITKLMKVKLVLTGGLIVLWNVRAFVEKKQETTPERSQLRREPINKHQRPKSTQICPRTLQDEDKDRNRTTIQASKLPFYYYYYYCQVFYWSSIKTSAGCRFFSVKKRMIQVTAVMWPFVVFMSPDSVWNKELLLNRILDLDKRLFSLQSHVWFSSRAPGGRWLRTRCTDYRLQHGAMKRLDEHNGLGSCCLWAERSMSGSWTQSDQSISSLSASSHSVFF